MSSRPAFSPVAPDLVRRLDELTRDARQLMDLATGATDLVNDHIGASLFVQTLMPVMDAPEAIGSQVEVNVGARQSIQALLLTWPARPQTWVVRFNDIAVAQKTLADRSRSAARHQDAPSQGDDDLPWVFTPAALAYGVHENRGGALDIVTHRIASAQEVLASAARSTKEPQFQQALQQARKSHLGTLASEAEATPAEGPDISGLLGRILSSGRSPRP